MICLVGRKNRGECIYQYDPFQVNDAHVMSMMIHLYINSSGVGSRGSSLPITPTSQYFHHFKVNLGTTIFPARKSRGGLNP